MDWQGTAILYSSVFEPFHVALSIQTLQEFKRIYNERTGTFLVT